MGLLAVLFVLEVMINASFLAEANIGGWLGGAVQAVSFAALNIIASFFCGLVLIRLLFQRNLLLKLIGLLSFLAYAAFATALNLTLAHLRELPPSLSGTAGQEVLQRLLTAPHALTDINSWVFFGVGSIFSLMAMADGLTFFDPCIGYAGLERRWLEASNRFAQARLELIDRLRDIREETTEVLNSAARDLSVRRSAYDDILRNRGHLAQLFTQNQNQAEQTCRALLEVYREANRRARFTAAPDYFAKPYNLDRVSIANNEPNAEAREELRRMIVESQQLLEQQIRAINTAFEGAIATYKEIDVLLPEKASG